MKEQILGGLGYGTWDNITWIMLFNQTSKQTNKSELMLSDWL